jgi:hypothetical protein
MNIRAHIQGRSYEARLPYHNAPHAVVDGLACPFCKAAAPMGVLAKSSVRGHDTVRGQGYAACCGAHIGGEIVVTIPTIFGLEEDDRVLNGRCRVY